MPALVRDDGPLNATLVLIGEAPGRQEEQAGRPFVGPSGQRLEVWWRQIGLTRSDFYITNVLPYRPENIDKVDREELARYVDLLHERLAALTNPVIIVPTGNYALYALTGKGRVSWHKKDGRVARPGIMDWRGSILSYTDLNGREIKVIPTLHPAAVLRQPSLERRAIYDWRRIAAELEVPEVQPPAVRHHINPTIEDVETFVARVLDEGYPVGLDIETPKGRRTEFQMLTGEWRSDVKKTDQHLVARYKSGKKKGELKTRQKPGRSYIGCVGLANTLDYSITVPLTLEYWKKSELLTRAEAAFETILRSDVPLVVQNGVSFDLPRLMHDGYDINTDRPIYDTRAMHHCLDPRDDHDLAYMASILTRFPFWKHEAKDPAEITKYASNSEALWTYCGIDTVAMLAIYYELDTQLEDRGLMDFYHAHYMKMIPAMLDMTRHGIQVNDQRRRTELELLNEGAAILQDLLVIADMPLVAKKGLSNDRLKFLFYGIRGFEGARGEKTFQKLAREYPAVSPFNLQPIRKKNAKGEKSITVDEITIRKLILKYPERLKELGPKLLDYRRNRKKAEFLDGKALDPDFRLRCSYSFVTEAGRFSSSSTPWGTGRNLQNIDRELRFVFIPDKREAK